MPTRILLSCLSYVCIVFAIILPAFTAKADTDLATKFTRQGGIINTRHNLTQSTIGAGAVSMNQYRNDYEEVCIYCHTPHGANTNINAPLWNRTVKATTYQTYDQLNTSTLTQPVTAPGPNSITCLTCHDGTTAVDSIINMPNKNSLGNPSANYLAAQKTTENSSFLDSWTNVSGADATVHLALDGVNENLGCLACHSSSAGFVGAGATDFKAFAIGTDLTNDHPVGITFPAASNPDFNQPLAVTANIRFFDGDSDGHADSNEIRLYDSGDGPEVECASCHDPHGVESAGTGSTFFPTFLRVSNSGSGVCLTCHIK